jgi:hypothetical protein
MVDDMDDEHHGDEQNIAATDKPLNKTTELYHNSSTVIPESFKKRRAAQAIMDYSVSFLTLFSSNLSFSLSLLGSTAQLMPWPIPQSSSIIQLNFLEAYQQFSFLQGRLVSPTLNPHPGGPGLCIYIPQRQGGYPF